MILRPTSGIGAFGPQRRGEVFPLSPQALQQALRADAPAFRAGAPDEDTGIDRAENEGMPACLAPS